MTISSELRHTQYTADGTLATYSYGSWRIIDETHLRVRVWSAAGIESTLTLTTDYTVTGVGNGTGGTIVLVSSGQSWLTAGLLTSGYTLLIERVVPNTQLTNVRGEGPYKPEIHEDEYDLLCMADQQAQADASRAIKIPDTEDPASYTLAIPAAADRAGKGLGFDSSGNVEALTLTSVGSPTDAKYITLATNASLSQERVLTGTANQVVVTDNGAGGTVVLSTPQNIHTAATPTFAGLTDSALTSGRVALAGTAGVLEDDGGLTYDKATDILSVSGAVKLAAASAPGVLAEGQVWNDSTQQSLANRSGGLTEYAAKCTFVQIAPVTVANTVTQTTLLTAGTFGTVTFPAGYFKLGKTVHVTAHGTLARTGTPTLTFTWDMFNGSSGSGQAPVLTTAATVDWIFDVWISCLTTGVGGTATAACRWLGAGAAGANSFSIIGSVTPAIAIDTTLANSFRLFATWSAADPANTVTCRNVVIEVMG